MAPDDTIDITPDWESTAGFIAVTLAGHGFERGAREPIVSLIEAVRYLSVSDPAAVERLLETVSARTR